jgi:hypothetical protein
MLELLVNDKGHIAQLSESHGSLLATWFNEKTEDGVTKAYH